MLKTLETLLEKNFGLISDRSTKDKLLKFIHKRCKELNTNFTDYINLLINKEKKDEWDKLVQEITINESYFFRVPQHFELLKKISKEILENKESLNILSEGCCTGEEPYTIAIVLKENLSQDELKNVYIVGTDVNRKNLQMAKKGIYSKRKVQNCSEEILKKYFKYRENKYILKEEIKKMCVFKYHNLLDFNYFNFFKRKFDIIFLRNVMIYFKRETNKKILDEIYKLMEKGGYLFTGASESLWGLTDKFEVNYFKDTFYYIKKGSGKKHTSLPELYMKKLYYPEIISKVSVKSDSLSNICEKEIVPKSNSENSVEKLVDLLENEKIKEFNREIKKLKNKGEILDKEIIFLMGISFFREGKYEKAIKEFKKLTFLDIDLITPRIFLSICFEKLKKNSERDKEIENIVRILEENRAKRLKVEKSLKETKDLDLKDVKNLFSRKEDKKQNYQNSTL